MLSKLALKKIQYNKFLHKQNNINLFSSTTEKDTESKLNDQKETNENENESKKERRNINADPENPNLSYLFR